MTPEGGAAIYAGYDLAGNIKAVYSCPAELYLQQEPHVGEAGHVVVPDGLNVADHYLDVDTLEFIPKGTMSLQVNKTAVSADGIDEVVIRGVPAGTGVLVLGSLAGPVEGVVDDGVVELVFDAPGNYMVRLFHPHYHSEGVQIDAA